jgi:phage shock protein A
MFVSSSRISAAEKAISNELDRLASRTVVSDAKLEKRVEALEKRVKELEDQLLEKHNEIMMLKRQVGKLNDLINSKT